MSDYSNITVEGAEYKVRMNIQMGLDRKETYQAVCQYNDDILETDFKSSKNIATNALKALIRHRLKDDKKIEAEREKLRRWVEGLPRGG